MKCFFNKLAEIFFSSYARVRGYTFGPVATKEEKSDRLYLKRKDINRLMSWISQMEQYRVNTVIFVA